MRHGPSRAAASPVLWFHFRLSQDTPKAEGCLDNSGVMYHIYLYVTDLSTYTTKNAPIQLQEKSTITSSAVLISGPSSRETPRPPKGYSDDPAMMLSYVRMKLGSQCRVQGMLQLQQISNKTSSAVLGTRVVGLLGQPLAVCYRFISCRGGMYLRPPEGCLDDSGVINYICM